MTSAARLNIAFTFPESRSLLHAVVGTDRGRNCPGPAARALPECDRRRKSGDERGSARGGKTAGLQGVYHDAALAARGRRAIT